jgi:xanthine/uracil/vitamin C permease (AzgA family)
VATATAISCGLVNIFIGFVCNVPFVATPSLATSLYVASYVRSFGLSLGSANLSTFLVGVIYMFCSHRGISQAIEHAFPRCIKHGARYIVTCCYLTCSPFVLVDLVMILLKTTPYFFLPPPPLWLKHDHRTMHWRRPPRVPASLGATQYYRACRSGG